MSKISYIPQGVCSRQIDVEVKNNIVSNVQFTGGCHGNTQAVARLVEGMPVEEVIKRLNGIDCKGRGTSCADQLIKAIQTAVKGN